MTLGKSIRLARKKNHLTQAVLAERIDVHEVTLRNWERDAYQPKASDITKLCEALKCTEAELLNGPQKKEFTVLLKFAKTIEEVEEEMMREQFSLTVTEDGYVGASGLAMLNSEQDIEDALAKIRFNLEQGYETKKRIAKDREGAQG